MAPRPALRFLLTVTGLLALPLPALAGGFEHQAMGAPALGRGGAYQAAVDDPMALLYNPAQLSAVPGTQLTVGANLPLYNSCFARAGNYPLGGAAGQPYPEVCNSASPLPAPYVALAFQPTPKLGIGVGVLAPPGVGAVRYGRADGTMVGPGGEELPTPSRYLLIERNTPLFFPTVGAAYEVLPWLRLGASFGAGMSLVNFSTAIASTGSEAPALDLQTQAKGQDLFVPRIGASVHAVPHDNLDVMLGFLWTSDIRARVDLDVSGSLSGEIEGATLHTPQPWQLSFGVRYADRIHARERGPRSGRRLDGTINDRMTNERWDVSVLMPEGANLAGVPVDDVVLPHNWRDQIALRIGGDYNVIPGMLALRAGLSFESNGVSRGYEQLSFRPGRRFGLHAGVTYRIAHRVDVSLAYAHLFEQSITLSEDEAQLEAQVGIPGSPSFTTNAGTFRSGYNVLSLGANIHF
jgi:long-chain fatty acid transport protein